MRRANLPRMAAVALALLLMVPPFSVNSLAAVPPVISESANPTLLAFPQGGGPAWANISLERSAHVRDARLTMRGEPSSVPTSNHLNSSTVVAGAANAWTGNLPFDAPDQAPEAYIATPFNATQISNASLRDGTFAKAPLFPNFTYQLLIQRVPTIVVTELQVLWSGYALPPSMPIFTNGQLFLYNFTSLAWDAVAAYPYPMTGVQDVQFNATRPANYIKPGTGSVALMVVSESTQTEVFTDFFEITAVVGVWPRPAVDVGADSTVDWRWDAPGWGSLGRQTTFNDGLDSRSLTFPDGGANLSASFLVPEGIEPSDPTVILRGVPDPRQAVRAGGPVVAGGSASLNVTGLETNSIGETSFVRLVGVTTLNETTDANRVARTGSVIVGSDPNGYRWAAQTFNLSATGPLSSVSVYIFDVQGNPGPLELAIEALNGTGIPNGVRVASVLVPQAAYSNDSWLTFAMGGELVAMGSTLSVVVRAPMAPPDTSSNYISVGASVNNSFADGEALSYFNVTSLGAGWSRPSNADFLFDLQQDLPLTSPEAALVTLDGVFGTYLPSGSSSNLSFTLASLPLANGSHAFTIANSNPNAIRFNWSTTVNYGLVAEGLAVSLWNHSLAGWNFSNPTTPILAWNFTNLTNGVELDLNGAFEAPNFTGPPNAPTPLRTLTFMINSSSSGAVLLSDLDIRYLLNITTTDVSSAFDSALWSTPAGPARADIPISVYSPGASQLTLVEAAITYDRPPLYYGFPSTVSDEDVPLITDLYSVFLDDYDNGNLSFRFDVISGSTLAFVALRGYNLTISPAENLSGDVVVNVTATDSGGLRNSSGEVTFTFLPVNDPPALLTTSLNVTWGGVRALDLAPYIVDADTSTSLAITAASGAQVTVSDLSLIFDFPTGAPDVDLLITLSDGAEEATYPLHIHPREANTPPVLLPIDTIAVPVNAAYWLDLAPYASDAEDTLAELAFALGIPTDPASPVLWTVEHNATSTYLKLIPRAAAGTQFAAPLVVVDTDGNANTTTVGIQIVAAPNVPPRIVGIDPVVGLHGDSFSIFLATKISDPEDGGNASRLVWSVQNDNPELFAAVIDPVTQTLVITPVEGASGYGSLLLRVVDSGGAEDTRTLSVTVVKTPGGSSASVLALGLFFGAVVLLSAIGVRRSRDRGRKPARMALGGTTADKPASAPKLDAVEGAAGDEPFDLPSPDAAPTAAGREDVGSFLRGLTETPTDKPPAADEGVVTLGLKSGLDQTASAAPATSPLAPDGGMARARLAELYLLSLKDGGLLFQAPPVGLPLLPQLDENEFLQWAYDTVRRSEKAPETAKGFDWREWKVVLARGNAFFIVGRARGEDFDALRREVKTLVEEVDHNFPGTPLDWQRTDTLETVGDILRRLVRGA